MKIFHITDHLPGYHKTWGGAEQVAYRYLKLLAQDGKDEIIVGTVKPYKTIEEKFKARRIRVLEDFFPEKYQIYITGLKNRILSFDPVAFFSLIYLFLKEKPQVVHLHKFNKISFSAILAAKLVGAKTIMGMYDYWYLCPGGMLIDENRNLCRKFHGAWCRHCKAISDFHFLLNFSFLRKPVFDYFLNKIDAFTVLSKSQGELLQNYGIPRNKIHLIRQVFDFSSIKISKIRQDDSLLYVGWLDSRKGPDIAINAMPTILKKYPKIKLNIIGEGLDKNYIKSLQNLIKKNKLQRSVFLLGKKTPSEVADFYIRSKAVIIPEQWENMSAVVLVEAMAYGKPVIVSNIGGLPEFIKDNISGLLADRQKPEEFANKALFVLRNPQEAIKIGDKAKDSIAKICDINTIKQNLVSLYYHLN